MTEYLHTQNFITAHNIFEFLGDLEDIKKVSIAFTALRATDQYLIYEDRNLPTPVNSDPYFLYNTAKDVLKTYANTSLPKINSPKYIKLTNSLSYASSILEFILTMDFFVNSELTSETLD